jgi:hypothetical protein
MNRFFNVMVVSWLVSELVKKLKRSGMKSDVQNQTGCLAARATNHHLVIGSLLFRG